MKNFILVTALALGMLVADTLVSAHVRAQSDEVSLQVENP